MTEYFNIGKFVAVHGLKGELLLRHELGKKSSLKDLKAIFTEDRKESFIPWFIESATAKSVNEIYLKLADVNTREAAMKLLRKEVWLAGKDQKKFTARSSPAGLLGYVIMDKKAALGEILEIIEQPQQVLCRLEINGKEVLVPLHEETLINVDHSKKKVWVELPEGLLDVYLNG